VQIDPWLSIGVFLSTAATDAVYVMFNAAVSGKRRIAAATWSSVWYLLSGFSVDDPARKVTEGRPHAWSGPITRTVRQLSLLIGPETRTAPCFDGAAWA